MTLYWWSHWFWITLLGNVLWLNAPVHTYPSQEISSLEYNQNVKAPKAVTKLYQTGTTLKWDEAAPTSTQVMDLVPSRLSKREKGKAIKEVEDPSDDEDRNKIHDEKQTKEEYDEDTPTNVGDFEYKRSAEIKDAGKEDKIEEHRNETHESAIIISKKPTITISEDDSLGTKEKDEELPAINDHQNITNNIENLSTNKTEGNSSSVTTAPIQKSPPSAPSVPMIDAEPAAAEWLKTAVVHFVPPAQRNLDEISSNFVTSSYDPQKVPFTLENVNREDELRRAESEHRTRKSKVLSAEYKHINRYINFSSDPRSLLTRSASASPNDFDNDSESNISSEALAVPRTYFLDAGAISAICFTVFGVCCTVGTLGLVLYRRRYLNKPQTLSEPDSSVYIDDSTMRVSDNSDEMYSLDNDSFLNSLEAMTIQNYWTDTVKHTKL